VAEFDLGHFDTGERLLRQALGAASAAGLHDQRATSTNYLCQLLIAAGRFGEAEETLTREIDLLGGYAADSPHQAYNRALLGKARIEDARPDDAGPEIETAWALLEKRPHYGILTLVRNYLAELLLQPHYAGRDIGAAENLLRESVRECRRTGFQRSEVAALCLLSLARQELGDGAEAVRHSTEAVRLLEAAGGTMPALRTEEVYHRHYAALSAAGRDADAADALRETRRCILAKADSIADPGLRTAFLRRVSLNRAALPEE
jgi:tetratricopeptide (TPR) repeat protein